MLHSQSRPDSEAKEVTLICFGAHPWISQRLSASLPWKEVIKDPLSLFSMVFEGLYLQLDSVTWMLGDVFGSMETVSSFYEYF